MAPRSRPSHPPPTRTQRQVAYFYKKQNEKNQREAVRQQRLQQQFQLILAFKLALPADSDEVSGQQIAEIVEGYLARIDRQLSELDDHHRKTGHRAKPGLTERLKEQRRIESRAYESGGMMVPDLFSAEAVARLRAWEEDVTKVPQVAMRRIRKNDDGEVVPLDSVHVAKEDEDEDEGDAMEDGE